MTIVALASGEPRVDRFAAGLAAIGFGGLGCLVWWLRRRPSYLTDTDAVEASIGRRAWRIVVSCSGSAIALLVAVLDPTRFTWALGLLFAAIGIVLLAFARRVTDLERRRGARVVQDGTGAFFLAR